jgi:putative transposase
MPECKKIVTLVDAVFSNDFTAMGRLFQPFLFLLATCTEHQLRRQIEFLKAVNEMLRKRVPKQRIFLSKIEREWLHKLGAAIGPGVAKLITIVHPRTYQRWLRQKCAGGKGKKMGRPKMLESIREIVVRIAKETGWRYGRILGELKKLRIHAISQSTIKNILKEAGMLPRPKRSQNSWDQFSKCMLRRSGKSTSSAGPSGRPTFNTDSGDAALRDA